MLPGLPGMIRAIISANARVEVKGLDLRSNAMARAIRRGRALFSVSIQDIGEVLFAGAVDDVGRASAFAAHAHVERAIEAKREAALGFIELHR